MEKINNKEISKDDADKELGEILAKEFIYPNINSK